MMEVQKVKTCDNCAFDHMCNHWENGWEACDSWQPTIVYCCECKHAIGRWSGLVCCRAFNYMPMRPDDFCSYGERKDGGADE